MSRYLSFYFVRFESCVSQWMRKIHQFSLESEQLRLQSDAAGPQDELEYWKCRAAQLTLLVDNISSPPARMTLATLKTAQSRILKVDTLKCLGWLIIMMFIINLLPELARL